MVNYCAFHYLVRRAWDHAEELDQVIVAAVKIEKEAPADGANGPAREPAEGAAAALGRD